MPVFAETSVLNGARVYDQSLSANHACIRCLKSAVMVGNLPLGCTNVRVFAAEFEYMDGYARRI